MAAKNGDTLRVHYAGTLDDGTEFDSSYGNEPLRFTLGEGTLIEGFEKALLGREAGETVTVRIPPEEAYGEVDETLLLEVPLEEMPEDLELEEGMELEFETEEGEMNLLVIAIEDGRVVLDANHPLAGQALNFKIEILEVN